MAIAGWAILAALNVPIYVFLRRFFFKDWEDLVEAIGFWFQPDFFSAMRGEWGKDVWLSFKLGAFIAVCVFLVGAEGRYLVIPHLLPWLRAWWG